MIDKLDLGIKQREQAVAVTRVERGIRSPDDLDTLLRHRHKPTRLTFDALRGREKKHSSLSPSDPVDRTGELRNRAGGCGAGGASAAGIPTSRSWPMSSRPTTSCSRGDTSPGPTCARDLQTRGSAPTRPRTLCGT